MSAKAYLTIDDSPSAQTDALLDFLSTRNVSALLFCRGDRLTERPWALDKAVCQGFVLANHAWSHRRFSMLSFEEGTDEILRTESLIDAVYERTGVIRPGKYFRFPHMDRGDGGRVFDFSAAGAHGPVLHEIFAEGLNIQEMPSDPAKKKKLQDWLRRQGFVAPPFPGITHEWYTQTEMIQAVDAMFTFSTADWMIAPRHQGKWPYKTLDDLRAKIDQDRWLARKDSTHVILAHDQDDLLGVVKALVDHFISRDFEFLPFQQSAV